MTKKAMLAFLMCWSIIFIGLPVYAFSSSDTVLHEYNDNDGNVITYPNTDQSLYSYDSSYEGAEYFFKENGNGTEKWGLLTGDEVYSSPAIGPDGTIYVGSDDKKVYAINPDGTKKWSFPTGNWVESSPAIGVDGTIYVGSHDNKVYAINPDGTRKWAFQTVWFVSSSPAIGPDGTIYVGSYDDKIYAINPDGTQKWTFQTGGDVRSSPAIGEDGTVYVGSWDDKVYAINPDGTKKWSFPTGERVSSSPAIGSNGVIYVGSYDNKVYAINPDGTQKWAFQTGESVSSSPSIGTDGTVYVGSCDNKVYAINSNGTQKWAFQTGGDVRSCPAIGADGTIYVGSDDNKVYAINPNGTQKWTFQTGDAIHSSPVIGADGTIYIGSDDKKVYAIEGDSGGLADSSWPMFHHDLTHCGSLAPVQITDTPVFNPDGGDHPGTSVDVTVSCATAGAVIRYTTDGSEPTESSSSVTSGGTVSVTLPGTLKAKAWKTGINPSDTKTANYTEAAKVDSPIFYPDGGEYTGTSVDVTVICTTSEATIRYTTDGSEPTESSSSVTSGGTVSVTLPGTLKARAWKTGMNPSDTKTANYTKAATVVSPVFNPDGGAHPIISVDVTVSCATSGATIRYTTDGSEPTESSSSVTSGSTVSVAVPGTLKARAWKTGMNPSVTKTAAYTFSGPAEGYVVISGLWIRAVFKPTWMAHFDLKWQKGGEDVSSAGDTTVWGYMYADPNDFPYGSLNNPEVFVKIYIAANGWKNVIFNHVTADDVDVYSALNYSGTPDQSGTIDLSNRVVAHSYESLETKSIQLSAGDTDGTRIMSSKDTVRSWLDNASAAEKSRDRVMADLDDYAAEEIIKWFYSVLLGTEPDSQSIEVWKEYLSFGLSMNVDTRYVVLEMGRMFFESKEYMENKYSDTQCIENAYKVFLNRMPTGIEISQCMDKLWLCEELMTLFSGSEEFGERLEVIFKGSYGNPERNLMAMIYSGILNRLVYPDELESGTAVLEKKGINMESVADLVLDVLQSDEFCSKMASSEDIVVRLFSTLSGRFPTSEEAIELTGQLESGAVSLDELVEFMVKGAVF